MSAKIGSQKEVEKMNPKLIQILIETHFEDPEKRMHSKWNSTYWRCGFGELYEMRHLLEYGRRILLVDHRDDQLFHHNVASVERFVRPCVLRGEKGD